MVNVIAVQIAVMMLHASLWFLVAPGQFTVAAISNRGILVLASLAVRGLRLSLHTGSRKRGQVEDPRDRKWREEGGSHATIRAYF